MKFSLRAVAAGLAFLPVAGCANMDSIAAVEATASTPSFLEGCSNVNLPFSTSIRAGLEPYAGLEIQGDLSTSCGYMVMVGLGGRVEHGSDFTGIQLTGRYVYPDGTMSAPGDKYYGTMPNGPEKYVQIPAGNAVVGVSIGQLDDNVNRIELRYRQVTVVNGVLQLTGPVYTATAGTGTPEVSYTISGNDTQVVVGAGFRSAVDKVKTMQLDLASLQ